MASASPDELVLQPVDGMGRWLGPWLTSAVLGARSMTEVPVDRQAESTTGREHFFLRDRYNRPAVDLATWRLQVSGVAAPRAWTYDDLCELPRVEETCVVECAGNGNHLMGSAGLVSQGSWGGPRFTTLLEACGGPGEATHFAFRGCDGTLSPRRGYHYGLSLAELVASRAVLALTQDAEPLDRKHGFSVRLVAPGIYSQSHVKWLTWIEGLTGPHQGFFNRQLYVNRHRVDGRWVKEEARWIGLKSVLVRCLRQQGGWQLQGQAWGGGGAVERVEVSVDGGASWATAELDAPRGTHAWTGFGFAWSAPTPGEYRVGARAFAADGTAQALVPPADRKGHYDQTHVKWCRVRVPGAT